MKKILMAAVALTALGATPAMAADFAVSGSVEASCGSIGDKPIAFDAILTNADGTLKTGQSKSSDGQSVYCNGSNSTISVSHAALKIGDGSGAPTNFTKTINFTTEVDFAGSKFTDGAGLNLGAKSGILTVTAKDLSADAKPLAGSYTGSITVTVSPGV